MFWVTRSGDVVESTGNAARAWSSAHCRPLGHDVVAVKRVSSGAFLGTRRIDKLRPATPHEVEQARERGKSKR